MGQELENEQGAQSQEQQAPPPSAEQPETEAPTAEDELRTELEAALTGQAEDQQGVQPPETEPDTASDETPDAGTSEDGGQPPDAEQPPSAQPESAADDEIPEEPQPGSWRDLRGRYKQRGERIKELETRLAEIETRGEQPEEPAAPRAPDPVAALEGELAKRTAPKQPAAPAQPPQGGNGDGAGAPHYEPDFVFDVIARADSGDLDASYKQAAETYISSSMTPAELRGVLLKARQSAYGERSPEIEEMAREWLPVVMAGDQERQRAAEQQRTAEMQRAQTWNSVIESYPEIQQPDSDTRKRFQGAAQALGEFVGQYGVNLFDAPAAPQAIAQVMEWQTGAQRAQNLESEAAKLRAENEQLKRRLGITESPQTGGRPAGHENPELTPEQELEAELAEVGILHR